MDMENTAPAASPADEMDDSAFAEMMQEAGSTIDFAPAPAKKGKAEPEPEPDPEEGDYELDDEDQPGPEPEPEEEDAGEEEEEDEKEEEAPAPALTDDTEIEIDMGEGEPVKANVAALKEAFKNSETVRRAAADLGLKYQELKQKHDGLENVYRMAAMEAQTEIDAYNGVDWLKLARDNPESYAKHRAYYDSMMQKRDAIKEKFDSWKQEHEAAEQSARQQKAAESLRILQKDIGLTQELHQNVREYALNSLGFDESAFDDIIDAGMYKAIYYAMQYGKGVREKNAKIKRPQNSNKAVAGKSARTVTSKKTSADHNGGTVKLPEDFSDWGIE